MKNLLSAAIARGSVPPTLLLSGPVGVGKYLVASATAAALNCNDQVRDVDGLAIDACGRCRSCDRIDRGVHVDVIAIEPDERASIKIDVIRDVLERTTFRPFEGRRRVVIIREADTLEPAAQNALLKSLEEPPPGTIFTLTTAVTGALLPTVRSRCMRLRFGRLTQAEVAEVLSRDHDLSPDNARALAALADGSVGAALHLDSADLTALREMAMQLLARAATGPAASRLQATMPIVTVGAKKDRERKDVKLTLRLVSSLLRDIELLNADADERLMANGALIDQLRRVARAYAGDRARASFAAVDRGVAALERNAGTKVVMDWVALQI